MKTFGAQWPSSINVTHHKREGTSEPSHFFDLYQLPSIFHFTTRLIKQIESTRHFPLLNPSHWLTFYFKYSNSRLPYALSLSVFINLVKFHTSPLSLHHLHFCLFLVRTNNRFHYYLPSKKRFNPNHVYWRSRRTLWHRGRGLSDMAVDFGHRNRGL